MTLWKQLEQFTPFCEEEAADLAAIRSALLHETDVFSRSNRLGHMSASAWVVNREHTHVLMAWHNLHRDWSWLGGHADGETDLLQVALREVQEESGLTSVRPLMDGIFSLEILAGVGHWKRGEYLPSHMHYNITYLLEADSSEPLHIKPDENSGLRWIPLAESRTASSRRWMCDHIYGKLADKLDAFLLMQ